jgi:hypothetical protein
MKHHNKMRLGSLLAGLALVVVGCGGGDDNADGATSTTAPVTVSTLAGPQTTLEDGSYVAFVHSVQDQDGRTSMTFDLLDAKSGREGIDALDADQIIDGFAERVDGLAGAVVSSGDQEIDLYDEYVRGFWYLVNDDPATYTLPVASDSVDNTFSYVVLGPPNVFDPAEAGPMTPGTSLLTMGLAGDTTDTTEVTDITGAPAGNATLSELGVAAARSLATEGLPVVDGLVLQPLSEHSGTPFSIVVEGNEVQEFSLAATYDVATNHLDETVLYSSWLNQDSDAAEAYTQAPLPYGVYSAAVTAIEPQPDGTATVTFSLVEYESIDTDADTTVTLGQDRQLPTLPTTTFEASLLGRDTAFADGPASYASILTTGVVDPEFGPSGPVTDFYLEIQDGHVVAMSNIKFS